MQYFGRLIQPYKWWIIGVLILGIIANALALFVPMLSARVIDQATTIVDRGGIDGGISSIWPLLWSGPLQTVLVVAVCAMLVAVVQIILSTFFAEKIALALRSQIADRIGDQSFDYVSKSSPGHLLTVATSDVDAVKNIFAQGLVALLGAAITLVGAAILLISINVKLGLLTLSVIPFLILTFILIFGRLSKLFRQGQETLERINAVINESVVGSALIRVLNSESYETAKFKKINNKAKEIGLGVVTYISALIPMIMLLSNIATIIIVWFGGRAVMSGTLSIGDFSAFIAYSAMFVWPLFILSFVGTSLSRGGVSLSRIYSVIDTPVTEVDGEYDGPIQGAIEFQNVSLRFTNTDGIERSVLKNISFKIAAGTRNAVVGPTAAGKTQLFYLMSGLVEPTEGLILIDGRPISEYKRQSLLTKIGLVFQDSIVFNTSLRENIALSETTPAGSLEKAIKTAELDELIAVLPEGLDTLVSERGTSLSGGQKQRMMLARALAVEPRILLLDDFTARVDRATEASILKNVAESYGDVTLVSITQKVEPIKDYDQVIVLMEGELVAIGTHTQLLESSLEYRQINDSQQTTNDESNDA